MAWDKTLIAEGVLAPDLNDEIRSNWEALEDALNKEMNFETGGTASLQGILKQGSARCYFQDTAPATRIDGSAFASTDLGSLWIDTNSSPDNQFNVLTATTPTWTPVSTEIIAVAVAAIHTWAAVQTFSEIPVFTKGLSANNSYLQARNAAGDGNVNLIKADASNVPILPDGAALAAATESADGDRTIVDLNYAKTGDTVAHDSEGGYQNADVNGTKTKVYTKYLTGTLDADSETSVAHGVTNGLTKILAVVPSPYNNANSQYLSSESYAVGAGANTINTWWNNTNVIFTSVGSNFQGQAYKLKIDYIL